MKKYEKPEAEKILLTALENVTEGAGGNVGGTEKVPSQTRPGL